MDEQTIPFSLEALKRGVHAALREALIFDIGSYGWLNENDPDPEFIGHAMWQTEQPPLDQHALFGDGPARRRPNDIEKEILTTGEDFCGLMEASRISIGLALLWKGKAQENPIHGSDFYWVHHTDAFLKLAIASDRLRDLLIIACTGAPPNSYKKGKPKPFYVDPFENAGELLARRRVEDPHLVEPLGALPSLGRELYGYISRRNVIVHEVATRIAQFLGKTVLALQQRYDQEQDNRVPRRPMKTGDRISRAKMRKGEMRLEINDATAELRNWHELLIHASNFVFQVEYWARRQAA